MTRATVITDASFCDRTKAAGWAAWIRLDGVPPIKRFGAFLDRPDGIATAEIWAAINGICIAVRAGADEVLVQSDAMAVIDAVQGKPHHHYPRLWRELFQPTLTRLDLRIPHVRAKHVRGHTTTQDARSYVNRWCDQHAKREMRSLRAKGAQP